MDLAMKNGEKWGCHIGNILGLTWINYSDRTAMALEWLVSCCNFSGNFGNHLQKNQGIQASIGDPTGFAIVLCGFKPAILFVRRRSSIRLCSRHGTYIFFHTFFAMGYTPGVSIGLKIALLEFMMINQRIHCGFTWVVSWIFHTTPPKRNM